MSQTSSLDPFPVLPAPTIVPLMEATTAIVAAYVSHHAFPADELPRLIKKVSDGLVGIVTPEPSPVVELVPAVPVKKSITPEFIICLDDGKKYKSLKRHLKSLGMTPEQYRTKWGLPADYPLTAPNYSAKRSDLAKQSGLGTKR